MDSPNCFYCNQEEATSHMLWSCSETFLLIQQMNQWLSLTNTYTNNTEELFIEKKKVREKSRECHSHKPQPIPDTKRKRTQIKPNKRKSNKRTKSTKISFLSPKRVNHNVKRTEKHKNKIAQGKT